jgi:hypothetical protein
MILALEEIEIALICSAAPDYPVGALPKSAARKCLTNALALFQSICVIIVVVYILKRNALLLAGRTSLVFCTI